MHRHQHQSSTCTNPGCHLKPLLTTTSTPCSQHAIDKPLVGPCDQIIVGVPPFAAAYALLVGVAHVAAHLADVTHLIRWHTEMVESLLMSHGLLPAS